MVNVHWYVDPHRRLEAGAHGLDSLDLKFADSTEAVLVTRTSMLMFFLLCIVD